MTQGGTGLPASEDVTDAGISALRGRIGIELRHLKKRAVVTQDWIDRFALGIGDLNPQWVDATFMRACLGSSTVAPPTMLFALSGWDIGTGLPGVHALYTGCSLEWERPIRRGERVRSAGWISVVDEREGEFAGRSVLQGVDIAFATDEGESLARARHFNLRTSRRTAQERAGQRAEQRERRTKAHAYSEGRPVYDDAELERAEVGGLRSRIRGLAPMLGDDLRVGTQLDPIVKGPLTITDIVGWKRTGFGGVMEGLFVYPHEVAVMWRERHPSAAYWHPEGYPEAPSAVHWLDEAAQKAGVRGAYDIGPERICWMGQAVTNWMGCHGFMEKLEVRLTDFVFIGDIVTVDGEVRDVTEATREHRIVDIVLNASNQEGDLVARGSARVRLPS